MQESTGNVDLSSSADVEAGLGDANLSVAEASARLEDAYREAAAQSEEQAAEAYPGTQEVPMVASPSPPNLPHQPPPFLPNTKPVLDLNYRLALKLLKIRG